MGFGQKLDALRKLDDAAAALPMPKAVDDVPVDAGDVARLHLHQNSLYLTNCFKL